MKIFARKQPEEVMGWRIAPPRWTFAAFWLAVKYLVLPVFTVLAALDVVFYLYFQHVLDRCYGVLCLFS